MSQGPAPAPAVTLTIDGKEVAVPAGTLIIRAAEELGIEIPRFCEHPLLDPIAACRQCYVSVEGQRKLMTSCSTPVAPGMAVHTQFTDPEVRKAQEAVLEFLLINHPLDCPICDRGGECPLQDQTLAFGPGESRYVEAKRTYRKPLPLSALVALDRERCVLCTRCVRFCDQISGERFIELFERGAAEQVAIAPGEDFRSPFSGNTIQICPVGALTASTYRFSARPFDLRSRDSVCPHCACGCALRVDLRKGEVVRHLARDNAEVNEAWLCDKGRFAFSFPDQPNRLSTPLLRQRGLEPASFAEVLTAIAGWARDRPVGFLAGGRLSDEDAYALSKLARTVFRTNDLDHRTAPASEDALPAERAQAAGMPVTYRDVEHAGVILVAGLDAEQELPILHLRIRKAARRGAKVFVLHPRRTGLHDLAEHVLCSPGSEADALTRLIDSMRTYQSTTEEFDGGDRVAAALAEAGPAAVILAGPRLAGSTGAVAAAAELAERAGARFALLARRAGDRGALRAGVHPALLPGGRAVADAGDRSEVESVWGSPVPGEPGRDTAAILDAAARREIGVLFLVGVDPLRDVPDAALARRALENVPYKVVVDVASDDTAIFADAILPAAAFLEKEGAYSDWEGRAQSLRPVRDPPGLARSEWEIFQELSVGMGADMGFRSLAALREEAARLAGGPGAGQASVAARARPRAAPAPDGAPEAFPSGAGHAVTLFSYPLLVDEGRLLAGADRLKEALGEPAFLEIHPEDAERAGLAGGGPARVRTAAGEAVLPVRISDGIVPGAAFVPYNQPGLAANTLLSGSLTTAAIVEPVEAEMVTR